MKRLVEIFLAAVSALASVACGNNTKFGEETLVIGKTTARSLGLKGPVCEVVTMAQYAEIPLEVKWSFDEKGVLAGVDTLLSENYWCDPYLREDTTFNAAGKPERINHYNEDDVLEGYLLIAYDEKGRAASRTDFYDMKDSERNYRVEFEYDDADRVVKEVKFNGSNPVGTDTYAYDDAGNKVMSAYEFNGAKGVSYCSFDKNGEQIAERQYCTVDGELVLISTDTVYVTPSGKERKAVPFYSDLFEAVTSFDKEGRIVCYRGGERLTGVKIIDAVFSYGKSGAVESYAVTEYDESGIGRRREVNCADFDTFGNWLRVETVPEYVSTVNCSQGLDEYLVRYVRSIKYYGEDQGDRYSFSGKIGTDEFMLSFQQHENVAQGSARLGSQEDVKIIGHKASGRWHFVGITPLGGVIYDIRGTVVDGGFCGEVSVNGAGSQELTLAAARNAMTATYDFARVTDEFPGCYRFKFQNGGPQGSLDVWRVGEDYGSFEFSFDCRRSSADSAFTTSFTRPIDGGDYYVLYCDDSDYEYKIAFYDDFAIVSCGYGVEESPEGASSPVGIYVRIPSVG